MSKECTWAYDNMDDFWKTECGDAFVVLEGTLKDNHMQFCPFCGKKIKESTDGKEKN